MTVEVREETVAALPDYARVPIAFRVTSRFRIDLIQRGLGGLTLVEEAVTPFVKDYDAVKRYDAAKREVPRPVGWAVRWNIANWGILGAFDGEQQVGGAVIAWNTDGVNMLYGRTDLAVLWDLRVRPERRGTGVGTRLFAHSLAWARERQCREILVETQNINVPACRFYAHQGCTLAAINRYAYPDLPDETQLLWYQKLTV